MVVRNYTGDDGQSHFEEIPLAFEVYGGARERTPSQAATGIRFIRWPAGLVYDWHNAPRRQYVILLSGQVELEVGDGTILQIRPGDVTLGILPGRAPVSFATLLRSPRAGPFPLPVGPSVRF